MTFVLYSPMLVSMFPGPESSKRVVVQCKGCRENIPAPAIVLRRRSGSPLSVSSFKGTKPLSPNSILKRAFVPRWHGLESLEKTRRCRQVAVNKGIGGPDRDRTDDLFHAMPDC